MPGKHITKQQVNLYMNNRVSGLVQTTSAAKAGISERSGRRIEVGDHQPRKGKRSGRTRKDPLVGVWDKELTPMLEKEPQLTPMTLLEYLQKRYVDAYPDSVLRTLQRRVKNWKALYGPEKELIFLQEHPVGKQCLSDFTTLKGVTIRIKGEPFVHLLYHFRLAFSSWSYIKVICGGESYTALTASLQEALWRLGGIPSEHRTDHLSAAFKNHPKRVRAKLRKELTERYDAFCKHYNMKATHNNLGEAHENGGIEGPHGHLKRRLKQALLLRDSNDFASIEEYQQFIDEVVRQHNRRNAKQIDFERRHLQPLPQHKATDFDEITVKVSGSGTIQVRRVTYALPSRLVGEKLRVHIYDAKIECHLGSVLVFACDRKHHKDNKRRARVINYRYMIGSLKKKPQAFRYCSYREDLLPSNDYLLIWQYIDEQMDPKEACKYIVRLLSLAADADCEEALGSYVLERLTRPSAATIPSITELQHRFNKTEDKRETTVTVIQHNIKEYDKLLPHQVSSIQEVCYA